MNDPKGQTFTVFDMFWKEKWTELRNSGKLLQHWKNT